MRIVFAGAAPFAAAEFLLGVGLFLIVCEAYKLLFYYFVIGHGSFQWWVFPLSALQHPDVSVSGRKSCAEGAHTQRDLHLSLRLNLLGGFLALLEPSGLSHDYWTLTLHGFVWHTLLVFIGLFLILSGNGPKSLKDFGRATVLFLILCGMAFCINLALFRASNGEINMFFVGPANTTLIVFKDIAARFGWYAATALYIPCVSFGAWLIFSAVRLLSKRLRTYAA